MRVCGPRCGICFYPDFNEHGVFDSIIGKKERKKDGSIPPGHTLFNQKTRLVAAFMKHRETSVKGTGRGVNTVGNGE